MNATEATPGARPAPGSVSVINLEKFRDTVLFAITIRKFGNSMRIRDMAALEKYIAESKVTPDDTNGDAPAVFVASDRVKSNKSLVRSTRLDRLNKAMNALKSKVEAISIPSYFRPGMFVSKQSNVNTVEGILKTGWQTIQTNELADFLKGYPEDIANARTTPVKKGGLGPLFVETDYPAADELAKLFSIDWFWLALSVPENIPENLRDEANEKFKKRMEDAAEQIELALRSELLELISHAEERLTPVPGEKPRVYRDSAIGNIIQFLNTFDSRDVFSDQKLSAIVAQARAAMLDEKGNAKMDPQRMRDYPSVRETARAKFSEIKEKLSGLIEEQGRKLDLSED